MGGGRCSVQTLLHRGKPGGGIGFLRLNSVTCNGALLLLANEPRAELPRAQRHQLEVRLEDRDALEAIVVRGAAGSFGLRALELVLALGVAVLAFWRLRQQLAARRERTEAGGRQRT